MKYEILCKYIFKIYVYDIGTKFLISSSYFRVAASPTSDSDKFKSGEGSLKFKCRRPRSRTGSGGILRVDVNKPTTLSSDLGLVSLFYFYDFNILIKQNDYCLYTYCYYKHNNYKMFSEYNTYKISDRNKFPNLFC